jgi:hypothetical protein
MEQYMAPWFKHNAVVDLLIPDLHTSKQGEEYTTKLVIEVKADRDYPILTQLGYRLPGVKDLQLMDVSLPRKGKHQLTIKSKEKPTAIQIDPFYRVPQVNLDNNTWQPHGIGDLLRPSAIEKAPRNCLKNGAMFGRRFGDSFCTIKRANDNRNRSERTSLNEPNRQKM